MFHGFGQTLKVFEGWIPELTEKYTVYTFDLFYHGYSTGPKKKLTKKIWWEMISRFLTDHKIKDFSVLGFSLGSRFALAIAMRFNIKSLYLIAPDGVYKSPVYVFAVTFRRFFKFLMIHPTFFNRAIEWVENKKIIDPSLIKFAKLELREFSDRQRVYYSWVFFNPLLYKKILIRSQLIAKKVKTVVFLGSKDKIIPVSVISPTFQNIESANVKILDCRHHELIDKVIPLLLTE